MPFLGSLAALWWSRHNNEVKKKMTQMSGANERFLNTDVILSEVMRTMEPDMVFMPLIPKVDSQGQPIKYGVKTSKSADTKKQIPRIQTASAKFPEVHLSRMTQEAALLNKEGFSIRLDEDSLNLPAGADMIMDGLQTLGQWIAESVNTNMYSTLDSGGTDSGATLTDWGTIAEATPLTDLRAFKNAMKREGKPYRMTDIFVEMTNFNELEEYLANSEYPAYRDAAINGVATGASSTMTVPMEGKPLIHGLHSGITHGDIMGLDGIHKNASTLFFWNNPKYTRPTISYQVANPSSPNGVETKTVDNFGLSAHQFFDDEKHEHVIQVWVDYVVVVKDAYGIITENGI